MLSNTAATALQLTGREEEETVRFVKMLDIFYYLNVTDLESGRRIRNAFKAPLWSGDDFKLKESITYFIGHPKTLRYCDMELTMYAVRNIVTCVLSHSGWKRNFSPTLLLGERVKRNEKGIQMRRKRGRLRAN